MLHIMGQWRALTYEVQQPLDRVGPWKGANRGTTQKVTLRIRSCIINDAIDPWAPTLLCLRVNSLYCSLSSVIFLQGAPINTHHNRTEKVPQSGRLLCLFPIYLWKFWKTPHPPTFSINGNSLSLLFMWHFQNQRKMPERQKKKVEAGYYMLKHGNNDSPLSH